MKQMKFWLPTLALSAMSFGGCTSDDKHEYNPDYQVELDKEAFAANFVKQYGQVDAEQSWDLANPNEVYMLSASARQVQTRAQGNTQGNAQGIEVNGSSGYVFRISDDFNAAMAKEFSQFGNPEPCYFTFPAEGLSIVPVFQSKANNNNANNNNANINYVLHMVVGEGDFAQDIDICSSNKGINNNQQEAKAYTITGVAAGKPVSFYVVSKGNNGDMENFSTLKGGFKLAKVDAAKAGNYEEGTMREKSSILACQFKTKHGTAQLAFLMDGLAPDQMHQAPGKIDKVVSRRYLIEDLGSTDDFDFNDIVIDVEQRVVVENGVEGTPVQKATLRHLGGVLPWNIKIGDTWFSGAENTMLKGEIGSDASVTKNVTGWNPEENNITVKVAGNQTGSVCLIPFPKKGEVPMVIAVDTYQQWMDERQSIPSTWWTEE